MNRLRRPRRLRSVRSAVVVLLVCAPVVVSSAQALPGTARSKFPAYPRYCPGTTTSASIVWGNCLLHDEVFVAGHPRATSSSLGVSPRVAGPGQKVTFTVSSRYKLCSSDHAAINTTTGCIFTIGWEAAIPAADRYIPAPPSATVGWPSVRLSNACSASPATSFSCTGTVQLGSDPVSIWSTRRIGIVVEIGIAQNGVASGGPGIELETAIQVSPHAPPPPRLLKVFVKPLENVRSGLAVHDHHYNQYPVDFVEAKASASGNTFRCESGCADVLVTVIDPKTHKRVAGAKVAVSADKIDGVAGDESICNTDPANGRTTDCGRTSLPGLVTDSNGELHLRYWAPGVIEKSSTTIRASARFAHEQGSGEAPVRVDPYLIYRKTSALTHEDIEELASWAGGTAAFTRFLSITPNAANGLTHSLKWLASAEDAAEATVHALEVAEKVEPIVGVIEVADAWNELSERRGMIARFMERTDLKGIGLGSTPFEASAPGTPSVGFEEELVNYGVVVPFQIGTDGAWWDIAKLFHKLVDDKDRTVEPGRADHWGIQLHIYEVSHCDPDRGSCDPGYGNLAGTSAVVNPGIEPELCFNLALLFDGKPSPGGANEYTFKIPYDAIAFGESQPNIEDVVHS